MKSVFIDCSPKKSGSASGFVANMTSVFVKGKKEKLKLRNRLDYGKILESLKDADNVIFCMPLYVDGIPSHILPFLKEMEGKEYALNVYVIANNGFIEGKQNEPMMQQMENFCERSHLTWCGGLGIGGGVMMNVMRIMICVIFALTVLNFVLFGFSQEPWIEFGKSVLEVLFFGCGIISFDIWLASCINQQKKYGKHYTRIMVPSFVFIVFADIFFIIISVLQGGIFRGLFKKY